jgi:hypothetical protein
MAAGGPTALSSPAGLSASGGPVGSLSSSPGTQFPVQQALPALIVLRRQSAAADAPFTLRFDLVDEDGRAAGQPRHLVAQGVFPAGGRFFYLRMDVRFEFPGPGTTDWTSPPTRG